jgi:isopentenyl phosphate kinase
MCSQMNSDLINDVQNRSCLPFMFGDVKYLNDAKAWLLQEDESTSRESNDMLS